MSSDWLPTDALLSIWLSVTRLLGGDPTIENVDDADDFTKTKEALSLLGVSDDLQHQVCLGCAASCQVSSRSRLCLRRCRCFPF
jgi:hypothetical protein